MLNSNVTQTVINHNALKASMTLIASIMLTACASSSLSEQSATKATTDTPVNTQAQASHGVQHITLKILGMRSNITTRDFSITSDSIEGKANKASGEITAPVNIAFKGTPSIDLPAGFKQYTNKTTAKTVLGTAKLPYQSVYKTLDGGTLNTAHINGTAKVKLISVPTDGVAAFGTLTPAQNVPTKGTVIYQGEATYRANGSKNPIEFGKSTFEVDFMNKTIKGQLTFNNAKTININTTIKGNTFTGINTGYEADGNFYGDTAKLLGGIYEGKNIQGTYNAVK